MNAWPAQSLVNNCDSCDGPEQPPGTRWLYHWDARVKIAVLAAAIGMNVVAAQLWLSALLLVVGLSLAIGSGIALRRIAFFFLAPAWATLLVALGFSMGFGSQKWFSLGPVTVYREGMLLGLGAAARVACEMSWIAAVCLTTTFRSAMAALAWFKVPAILLDAVAMAYRYAWLLMDQFVRMRVAATARGGFGGYLACCRSTALILSQIVLQAYDRTHRIQQAMTARGQSTEHGITHAYGNPSEGACPNRCDITPNRQHPSQPVLRCIDVSYAYQHNRSVSGVSLTVQPGELVVLCGPNGAGKSTLLKLFSGILLPDSGQIHLDGQVLDKSNRTEAFHKVGLLLQDPNDQLFCTHVREDVAYGPVNKELPFDEVDRLVETAMELMEVSHLRRRPIHCLSHGEMRRVGLAGIIAMQPPLILLDEPTASLDPASSRHLVGLIRHLNSHHGYTLITVTHDINLASEIATRVIILDQGAIVADGSPRTILTNRCLLEQSRLEPPLLTRLFQELGGDLADYRQIPLTIEEALGLIREMQFCNPQDLESKGFSESGSVSESVSTEKPEQKTDPDTDTDPDGLGKI